MRLAARRSPDSYRDEAARRLVARAPVGFAVFLFCLALSTLFEVLRFPDRRRWMLGYAAGFVVLVALCWVLIRRRPAWTTPVMVGFVNIVAVAITAYHVTVGASLAMCVWQLTALVASSAVILPWGPGNQALASAGVLLSYPAHLEVGAADPLAWAAGGAYLVMAIGFSVFGAALLAGYVRRDLRLRAALSEREARLQSYFDLSVVGTAILTADGRCSEVNDELCRMFGYARPEFLGRSWRTLVLAPDRSAFAGLVREALSGTGGVERREMQCVRKDGGAMDAIVHVRGLPGPHGAIDHVMILVHDVTERRRTEAEREHTLARMEVAYQRAEEASRAKDDFLATVSHELRTPLTPILAWSSMLRKGHLGTEKAATALAAIEHSAKAQAQLIEDLLDVSRIVAGEWRLTLRALEIGPIVQRVVELMQPAADAQGATIEMTLPTRPVAVRGDPQRLEQILWNLLANAVKFTPSGGRVEVGLASTDTDACIMVRDTGEGIDPEFLPHVFERFRQAESFRTRRHGGLGLGLSIVRALVEFHGGTVRAESPGRGLGAVFTVLLPLAQNEPAPAGATRAGDGGRPAALGGLHVLVVDDDPGSNAVVSALLASRGVEVRTAASTLEALEIAGRWPPDVIVSDIAMPGEDGYALLRKLRAHGGPLGQVPAIALTAYAGTADRLRLLDAGFHAHIAKPFDPATLTAAVEDAVQRGRRPSA